MNKKIMNKRIKGRNKGMMTLEACVIVPLILVASVLLFWIGVLLYDRGATDYVVSAAALRGGRIAEADKQDIAEVMKNSATAAAQDRLVLLDEQSFTMEVGYGMVEASMDAALNVPEMPLYGGDQWDASAVAESPRIRESQIIRTIYRMDKAGENVSKKGTTE